MITHAKTIKGQYQGGQNPLTALPLKTGHGNAAQITQKAHRNRTSTKESYAGPEFLMKEDSDGIYHSETMV